MALCLHLSVPALICLCLSPLSYVCVPSHTPMSLSTSHLPLSFSLCLSLFLSVSASLSTSEFCLCQCLWLSTVSENEVKCEAISYFEVVKERYMYEQPLTNVTLCLCTLQAPCGSLWKQNAKSRNGARAPPSWMRCSWSARRPLCYLLHIK